MERPELPSVVYVLTALWLLTAIAGYGILPGHILTPPHEQPIWNDPSEPYVRRALQGSPAVSDVKFPPYPVLPPLPPAPPGLEYPLATNRTDRPDPLNGLNVYIGGWNLTNQHYWAVSTQQSYRIASQTSNGA